MSKVPELFGSLVFNDTVMKERLPKNTYKALKETREQGKPLDSKVADVVANTMKEWALEKGATHFTHRNHGGKARQLHLSRRLRQGSDGVFRQRAH